MITVKEGDIFNSLTVIAYSHSEGSFKYYLCRCGCGNEKVISIYNLVGGKSKTCGCAIRKHGLEGTSEYAAWRQIKYRCYNKKAKAYPRYGGRGIKVCSRWMESFNNFIEDMGSKPTPLHSLDRIENNKDYEPSNCRWATKREQANNRKNTVVCEFNGVAKPVTEWGDILKVKTKTLMEGIRTGKDISYYVNKYGFGS